MRIEIKATNIEVNDALKQWIEDKFSPLAKWLGELAKKEEEQEGSKIIFIKLQKTTRHHLKGDIFRVETQVYFLGRNIRAEAISSDIRSAVDLARDKLQISVDKQKKKLLAKKERIKRIAKIKNRLSEILRRRI